MRDRFDSFGGLVLEVNRCIQKMKDVEMKSFNLRAGHMMILYHLSKQPDGLTATALTRLCREDKAAISRGLKELSDKGIVICDAPVNKRSYRSLNRLTEEGHRIASTMNSDIDSLLLDGSEGVTNEEREVLYKVLYSIRDNLNKHLDSML